MVYPGAQHNTPFSYGNTAATLFMRLTGFFMQHLAGEKAPAAAAAAAAPMVL
jgi:hypothetical protein